MQTIDEEDQIKELKGIIGDKEDTIRVLKDQLTTAAVNNKSLEDKISSMQDKLE